MKFYSDKLLVILRVEYVREQRAALQDSFGMLAVNGAIKEKMIKNFMERAPGLGSNMVHFDPEVIHIDRIIAEFKNSPHTTKLIATGGLWLEISVNAHMPCLVARVVVNDGDVVKKGQEVAVINYMKIELSVISENEETFRRILVKEWDEMEVGKPMVILEVT